MRVILNLSTSSEDGFRKDKTDYVLAPYSGDDGADIKLQIFAKFDLKPFIIILLGKWENAIQKIET